jgi:hypothetical protein
MRVTCLVSLSLVVLAGCARKDDPSKRIVKTTNPSLPLPPGFKLDLPTAPIVIRKPDVPVQYADGSYSVYGLLTKRSEVLGKEVHVSAFIVELNAPKKPKCPPCQPPHLYLADAAKPADDAQRLLVADFTPIQVKKLSPGERYRFSGKFQTTSLSRFSRAEGLLSFNGAQLP